MLTLITLRTLQKIKNVLRKKFIIDGILLRISSYLVLNLLEFKHHPYLKYLSYSRSIDFT